MQGRELGWPVWGFVSMRRRCSYWSGFVKYERYKTAHDGSPLVALGLFRIRSFVQAWASS